MNFLEICQRSQNEAGIEGEAISTVVGQTGRLLRLTEWVNTAYIDIIGIHDSWLFLRSEFSFPTVSGTQNYSYSDAAITDFGRWDKDTFRIYSSLSDEVDLEYCLWQDFRAVYKKGAFRSTSGRPNTFSILPDQTIDLYPIPNAIFTVNGEYVSQPTEMSTDSDEPVFPSQFHMAIVWRTVMLIAGYSAGNFEYVNAQNEFRQILNKMEKNQLPQITWGAPLC